MEFSVLDTDPLLTTLHQLVHTSESDLEREMKRQRPDYLDELRHVTFATPVDVQEEKSAYLFIADVPGLQKSDIQVQVENDNVLTMRGAKRKIDEEEEEKEEEIHTHGTNSCELLRKFILPSDAQVDAITAVCVDGVFTVTVPKLPPTEPAKPKTVRIAVSWRLQSRALERGNRKAI